MESWGPSIVDSTTVISCQLIRRKLANAQRRNQRHINAVTRKGAGLDMKIFNITPMGKPRMTRADKWKQREVVMRYRAFCDEVRLKNVAMPEQGGHITFVVPMPKSWSQKKRVTMNGQAHQQKPDADNMIKALMDALFTDDAHIWDFRVTKVWGESGQILISDIGEVAA